jgi:hypothetical protein
MVRGSVQQIVMVRHGSKQQVGQEADVEVQGVLKRLKAEDKTGMEKINVHVEATAVSSVCLVHGHAH